MRHPPYQLRPNKAVDRFTLIEAIRRLEKLCNLRKYTYYGLGGPYLEDFRLLYEFCPEIAMVSMEEDKETYKRQKFHLPCGKVQLKKMEFHTFLNQYEPRDKKSIFWLDYTHLEYPCFDDFMALLVKVGEKSMIKITLRSEPRDFVDKAADFRRQFDTVMPDPSADPPATFEDFAYLLQGMLGVAAEQALPSTTRLVFQPVSSFYYADGVGMFTLTGVVWPRSELGDVKKAFRNWEFANLTWERPRLISIPILSAKERLHLQSCLPRRTSRGTTLLAKLGYLIDDDIPQTEAALEQYAAFHRYSPYFLRGVP